MTLPSPDQWHQVGSNESARYYLFENGVIVVVPHEDVVDTEATARAAITLQIEYWRSVGRAGASVVLLDPVLHQEAGARRLPCRRLPCRA